MAYQAVSVITCDAAGCGETTTLIGTRTAADDHAVLTALGWHHVEGVGVYCPECFYQIEARAA